MKGLNIIAISKRLKSALSQNRLLLSNIAIGIFLNIKQLADNLFSTDSGYFLGQSYVDNIYYFEEDYVGYKRTF